MKLLSKYLGIVVVALSIDAFQFLIGISLTVTLLGISASVAWIPFVGAGLAAAATAAGEIFGTAVDWSVSATFGTGFIFLLWQQGFVSYKNFFSRKRMSFIIVKLIPGIDMLPAYTTMTVLAILEKERELKQQAASGKGVDGAEETLTEAPAQASVSGQNALVPPPRPNMADIHTPVANQNRLAPQRGATISDIRPPTGSYDIARAA